MASLFGNRYFERQSCAPWVYALFAVVLVVMLVSFAATARHIGPNGYLLLLAPVLSVVGAGNFLIMQTRVDDRELIVRFGWLLPLYSRRVPLAEIESAEAVVYNPIMDYGGWGIRGWGKRRALNMRGNRGVQLVLKSGERLLIGSGQPQELVEAIQK